MLTFKTFAGINNVQPAHRLTSKELTAATNADISANGALSRRAGYSEVLDTCHKNLWQAQGFMLATVDGNDLVAIAPNGDRTTVQAALGPARVWYVNLPDGRTAFSNGAISGLTSGGAALAWGVSPPASVGAATETAGSMLAGEHQYALTFIRLADGLESAPTYAPPEQLEGGFMLTGLPTLSGHKLAVYLDGLLIGTTLTAVFTFTGAAASFAQPLRTEFGDPPPAGRCLAFWRGRALVAEGSVLYASRPHSWAHFDLRRDFKQFSGDVTSVVPVEDGLFVGTTTELAFLRGTEFDKLSYTVAIPGPVVLGSGVSIPNGFTPPSDSGAPGNGAAFIADQTLVMGFANGSVTRMGESRYRTDVAEVAAVFRFAAGVPQYIAIPQ